MGGNANNSVNTGTFYMNANNTSSNANRNISSHLCLKVYLELYRNLASWQKTKKGLIQPGRNLSNGWRRNKQNETIW